MVLVIYYKVTGGTFIKKYGITAFPWVATYILATRGILNQRVLFFILRLVFNAQSFESLSEAALRTGGDESACSKFDAIFHAFAGLVAIFT